MKAPKRRRALEGSLPYGRLSCAAPAAAAAHNPDGDEGGHARRGARYLLFPYDGLCRYLGSEAQRRRTAIRRWGGSLL